VNGEATSPTRLALNGDEPAMLLHDAVGDGQPEPSGLSHRLGGEEGLEYVRKNLGSDAIALVCHDDLESLTWEP
jgi:hypothetical protein